MYYLNFINRNVRHLSTNQSNSFMVGEVLEALPYGQGSWLVSGTAKIKIQ